MHIARKVTQETIYLIDMYFVYGILYYSMLQFLKKKIHDTFRIPDRTEQTGPFNHLPKVMANTRSSLLDDKTGIWRTCSSSDP